MTFSEIVTVHGFDSLKAHQLSFVHRKGYFLRRFAKEAAKSIYKQRKPFCVDPRAAEPLRNNYNYIIVIKIIIFIMPWIMIMRHLRLIFQTEKGSLQFSILIGPRLDPHTMHK